MQTVPVSATAKFAPLTPTLAARNFARRKRRAASASAAGSSSRCSLPGSSRRNSSRILPRLRWIAGTGMCDGRSCPSWMISSARSVSCAWIPRAASVASDFTLTTSRAPAASITIRFACAPSAAQCTMPPAALTERSSCSRWTSRCRIARSLIRFPASPSCSQSPSSAAASARFSRIVCVAWSASLRRYRSSSRRRFRRSPARFRVGERGQRQAANCTQQRKRRVA
jgi:hypothetical protein